MRQKRSRFLTFVFSFLPGAGHMFMGFMKMGISLMSVFFLVIFLSSWLNISPLLFTLPIIWFFAFFDCMNRRYTSDEEFALLEDNYLFSVDTWVARDSGLFQKHRLYTGILLVLLGIYLLWRSMMNSLFQYLPEEIHYTLQELTNLAPQIVLGIAIILAGVKLVIGKKKESEHHV